MQLKVSNKRCLGNSIPGDLIVAIEELSMSSWNVKERIYTTIYTSVLLKQFLDFKDIEAINGKVRIKLEEGIQSGKNLRLKERNSKYQWLRKRRFIM
jgi:molecular chaperone DnaJ